MIGHGKSGTDFRVCREYLGWSQVEAARIMGVKGDTARTIKRWESPTDPWEPWPDTWGKIDDELAAHDEEVDRLVADATDAAGPDKAVTLVYHHDRNGADLRPDHRPAGWHDACVREAASFLAEDGISVSYVWASVADTDDPSVVW